MQKLFGNKSARGRAPAAATYLDSIIGGLQEHHSNNGRAFASTAISKAALSMESIADTARGDLEQSLSVLNTALESVINNLGMSKNYTKAQLEAAKTMGMVSASPEGFLRQETNFSLESTENFSFVGTAGMSGAMENRTIRGVPALEAYDERDNKNAVVYSVAYNLQAARQDEFGEAFFPTVVVTPDQVGYTVSIRLVMVYDEVSRNISGALDNFNRKNIIQAVIDPTILANDQTKIYPVYRTQSEGVFVPAAVMAPYNVTLDDGEVITTSALAMGVRLSLLGVSQTDLMLQSGNEDSTDAIDTAVVLQNLYLSIPNATTGATGPTVIKFPTYALPRATFNYSIQDNYRLMTINFDTNVLQLFGTPAANGNPAAGTTDVTGALISANTALAAIVTQGLSVRLQVQVGGNVNLQTADTSLYSSNVTVYSVTDANGNVLPLTSGEGATIVTALAGATIAGYDLDARRSNLNRRQRGQLLDTTFYNQCFAVPLLSPITVPRPMTQGDSTDSSDLAALITTTHIRTSNSAVSELLRVGDLLAEYVNSNDYSPNAQGAPAILGVARWLVSPFYEIHNIDVASQIDSLSSTNRPDDIQALLVNAIRDVVYRMYRDTGYKAAADALAGGVSETPTVIIGTDIVLARYLMVTGDFRTLGGEFNVKLVSTLNKNMKNKIVVTFGQFGEGTEGVPNPMHFGNMAWKPEMTVVLPLHRNGGNSKELTVQPSYRHIINLPIMAMFNVTGISSIAANKVPVGFYTFTQLPT